MEPVIDKSKELHASVELINNKLQFRGTVEGNNPVLIDYVPPLGDNMGYTSLELLLLSLSSCAGSAILVILRKMQKSISAFGIDVKGIRREEHPTCFKSINLGITLKSTDISLEDMSKVTKLIEGLCPVLTMVKGNVEISYTFILK